ncbi:mechanosensitive ion channel protein MscS [Azorhizobium oxalatiphilum]|uniref:Mechanosensitive ion channel protein MscS n=1 Tax=Azorhizobium oxalatiphilum TaxID=980631 RepID=A0A917FKZ4_9HYPH|nr:DUF3772 domain-containing protein [Azorhizobium oxalatiphilum]GGF87364.1 mechanosensitive ion channel protein MscS [Azorhizobium oxalatiphilum]
MRRTVVRIASLLALILCMLAAPAVQAAPPTDPAIATARERLEANRSALDALDAALGVEGLRAPDLDDLRTRLDPVRRDLQTRGEILTPRAADAKMRLEELGAPPAAGAAPEDASVTADREHLKALTADIDGLVKQNRALAARADQLSERISTRRRELFTGQLFERSISIVDPSLWATGATALQAGYRSLSLLVTDSFSYARQRQDLLTLAALSFGVLAIVGIIVFLGRALRRRLSGGQPADGVALPRLRAVREAIKVAVFESLVGPLATIAAVNFLTGFDIVPPRAAEILHGLVVAVFIHSVGRALAKSLLAPGQPWRRLPAFSDATASAIFRYYSWSVTVLAVASFVNALNRALFTPVALTVLASGIGVVFISVFIGLMLVSIGRIAEEEEARAISLAESGGDSEPPSIESSSLSRVRTVLWLVIAVMVGALVAGYVSFASFLGARILVAAAVLAALYILYSLIDAFFGEGLAADTHRSRMLSKTLGLRTKSLEVIATLISGLLKLFLFVVAALVMAGSWGTSSADIMETIDRVSFGVHIGTTTITLWNVLYAVALLIVGILLARGLQKWVSSKLLPGTGMEASLQTSISTIIGYVGIIFAIMIAMGQIGLNLENIALVAGALSVGIGFGLQAIISNFVSGLILLTERPIRVGDTINVKGEEGYVRRISVRSTEIETFERATVIVPNSDLITGMVKNWTHSNTTGRVIVALNVTYDSDVEEVRDILVACACDHPQVLQSPPPRVFITKFADAGILFELRCVVANVDYSLTVKSDLHFSILRRFRQRGVVMASQPWAAAAPAHEPEPEAAPEPQAAPEASVTPPRKGGGSIGASTG